MIFDGMLIVAMANDHIGMPTCMQRIMALIIKDETYQ